MVNTSVALCGKRIDNPIIPASGAFGYGREFAELYDIGLLGTFSFKGTTLASRFGNPTPRIAECPSGMLNAVGLQNPGVDRVISEELPNIEKILRKPVMANVCGFSVAEYAEVSEKLADCSQVGWLEINISCPNVKHGGMSFGTTAVGAAEVTRAVRKVTTKPVIIKLSPNVTDITEIARACEAEGADGVSLINTLLGMRININKKAPVLKNVTGGLSGAAVLPVALACVYRVYNAVKIPIVGLGGISNTDDVIEMLMAGATAVEIGSANLVDPFVCERIVKELPERLESLGISDINDIIGAAHRE